MTSHLLCLKEQSGSKKRINCVKCYLKNNTRELYQHFNRTLRMCSFFSPKKKHNFSRGRLLCANGISAHSKYAITSNLVSSNQTQEDNS